MAIGLFIGLKYLYTLADNDALLFLLKPTNALVAAITNSTAVYSSDAGFFHQKLDIVINKSCSGFNYWILGFIMSIFMALQYPTARGHKISLFPVTLALAYLLTLFVNTSRILVATYFLPGLSARYAWIHQAQGVFIYLSFLILFYLIFNHSLTTLFRKNEKFA